MLIKKKKKQVAAFSILIMTLLAICLTTVVSLLWPGDLWLLLDNQAWGPDALAFFVLALLVVLSFQLSVIGGFFAMVFLVCVAGVFELVQIWAPFRYAALSSWIANSFFIALGVGVGTLAGRVTQSLLGNRP